MIKRVFIAVVLFFIIIIVATADYGTENGECERTIPIEDEAGFDLWVHRAGGFVDYSNGEWRDSRGQVIGYSKSEDSTICVSKN